MAKTTKQIVNLMEKNADQRLRQINPSKSLLEKVPKTDEAKKIKELKTMKKESSDLVNNVNRLMVRMIKATETITRESLKQTTELTKGSIKALADTANEIKNVISEDISFNKQAIAAQMFRNISPVFGYFIGKFFETPTFRKIAESVKEKVSSMFGSIAAGIADIFKGGFSKIKDIFGGKLNLKKMFKIPSLQVGGYVTKGGMVNVHPAEVIMPVEKAMAEINKRAQEQSGVVSRTLSEGLRLQYMNLRSFVEEESKKTNIFMDFIRNFKNYQENYLRSIKLALAGQITFFKQFQNALETTLENHIFFRFGAWFFKQSVGFGKLTLFGLIRQRPMFANDLPRTNHPVQNQIQTLHLIYTGLMWQLENIKNYIYNMYFPLRDMAAAITGRDYPEQLLEKRNKVSVVTRWIEAAFQKRGKQAPAWMVEDIGTLIGAGTKKLLGRTVGVPLGRAFGLLGHAYKAGEKKLKLTTRALLRIPEGERISTFATAYFSEVAALQLEHISKKITLVADTYISETKRQKVRAIWDFIKNSFFTLKNLAGSFLSGIKDTITSFIGGVKDFVIQGATAIFASSAVKSMGSTIAGFIPEVMPLIISGSIGTAIGSWINDKFIQPWMDKRNKRIDEQYKEMQNRTSEIGNKVLEKVRGGDQLALRFLDIRNQFKMRDMSWIKETYGWFTADVAHLISKAQEEIMLRNSEIYAMYGAEQVSKLRKQFWKEIGWKKHYGWPDPRLNPEGYGKAREQAFLDYLRQKGTIIDLAMENKKIVKDTLYDVKKTVENVKDKTTAMVGLGHKKLTELSTEGRKLVNDFAKKYGITTEAALAYYNSMKPEVMRQYMKIMDKFDAEKLRLLKDKYSELKSVARTESQEFLQKVMGLKDTGNVKAKEMFDIYKDKEAVIRAEIMKELRSRGLNEENINKIMKNLEEQAKQGREAFQKALESTMIQISNFNTENLQNIVNQGKEKAMGWFDQMIEAASPYVQKILSGELF